MSKHDEPLNWLRLNICTSHTCKIKGVITLSVILAGSHYMAEHPKSFSDKYYKV
jgi:hypothetical protein